MVIMCIREAFKKKEKKSMEFSILGSDPPPPPMENFSMYFFYETRPLSSFIIILALVDAPTIRGTPEFKGRNP